MTQEQAFDTLVCHEGSHGRATEFVHVLCGPDTDGEGGGEITAFPRLHLEMVAEVI